MKVIVLAHPRSGTRYVAHCFRCGGWDVQHEQVGSDGISSWMWAAPAGEKVPWGASRRETDSADVVLHVMREPGAAISSIAYTEGASEPWRSRWIVIPKDAGIVERAIWSYYGWNALIGQRSAPTHRAQLEQIELAVARIVGGADPLFMAMHPRAEASRHPRPHPSFCMAEIATMTWKYDKTAGLLKAIGNEYGLFRVKEN